jgi:hypothetical protein
LAGDIEMFFFFNILKPFRLSGEVENEARDQNSILGVVVNKAEKILGKFDRFFFFFLFV